MCLCTRVHAGSESWAGCLPTGASRPLRQEPWLLRVRCGHRKASSLGQWLPSGGAEPQLSKLRGWKALVGFQTARAVPRSPCGQCREPSPGKVLHTGRGASGLWPLTVSQGHVLIGEAPRESAVLFSRKGAPSGGKELGTVFTQ